MDKPFVEEKNALIATFIFPFDAKIIILKYFCSLILILLTKKADWSKVKSC